MKIRHKMRQLVRFFADKDFRFSFLDTYGFYNLLNDEAYLKRKYKSVMGKELNLANPETFNEKLQWLKLYDRNPQYTMLVDKDAVKKIVSNKIGDEYIIPTLGIWDNANNIDFESLPKQFVLKCTHDSGKVIICENKLQLDREKVRKNLNINLRKIFFFGWKRMAL